MIYFQLDEHFHENNYNVSDDSYNETTGGACFNPTKMFIRMCSLRLQGGLHAVRRRPQGGGDTEGSRSSDAEPRHVDG